jgi:hypothetical protein
MTEIISENTSATCVSRCVVIRRCPWVYVAIVTHLVTHPLTSCHVITSNR